MRIAMFSILVLSMLVGGGALWAQMTAVNGASFSPNGPMAPGSFVTLFGHNLCLQTATGDWIGPGQLPTVLGGCSVTVNGAPAMMHYVSPGQVNFVAPGGVAPGMAEVRMHSGLEVVEGSMMMGAAGPGVFAMNGMGVGRGAMLHGTMWQEGPFSVTTNGQPTHVSIYVTGLDLASQPVVEIGGIPVDVTWFGNAPGYAGLQQINIGLPEQMAGVGMVPVTVTSSGVTSNVTFMNVLPTTGMMQGMPGWGPGMMVGENMRRGRETSYLAYNASDNTVLVTDEEDDVLRMISLDSFQTVRTITLPDHSEAQAVAVNTDGTVAAVALSRNAAVALIDLQQIDDITVVGTGVYPSHLAFSGNRLLVTNTGSGDVTVIDAATRSVIRTVQVGFGPTGIAADQTRAVVANMQGGTVSIVDLTDYSMTTVDLPPGTRPHEVAIDSALNKAVITTPMSNGFSILDLATNQLKHVATSAWNAMGPGAVVTHNARAYIANQMTASVTVVDLNTDAVVTAFSVDPGPRSLAMDAVRNRLLVLSHGTGVLSVVDLDNYAILHRVNATEGDRAGNWTLPAITSISPLSAKRGTTFTMTINGLNLQGVKKVEFHNVGPGSGMGSGGMMDDDNGTPGHGTRNEDETIKTSDLLVNESGTQITVTVEIDGDASPGSRRVGLEASRGEVMGGPMFNSWFAVTE